MPWAWLLNGRVIVGLCVAAFLLLAWARMSALEDLAEQRLQQVARLEAEIAHRDAVMAEVAKQAALREQAARDAVLAARRKAEAGEAELARLRAGRPNTGDACRNAEILLRQFREGAR